MPRRGLLVLRPVTELCLLCGELHFNYTEAMTCADGHTRKILREAAKKEGKGEAAYLREAGILTEWEEREIQRRERPLHSGEAFDEGDGR